MSLTSRITISLLALSGAVLAAPVSHNGTVSAKRDDTIDCDCTYLSSDGYCYYGDKLTLDDYLVGLSRSHTDSTVRMRSSLLILIGATGLREEILYRLRPIPLV